MGACCTSIVLVLSSRINHCILLFSIHQASGKQTDAHPWVLAAAGWASFVFVFAFYFGYLKENPEALPINSGIMGFILQMIVIVILEVCRRLIVGEAAATEEAVLAPTKKDDDLPSSDSKKTMTIWYASRPEWDIPALSRFGDRPLTPQLIQKSMKGIREPITDAWWLFMLFCVTFIVTPLTPEFEPPLDTDGVTGTPFLYTPAVIRGLPWWAFKIILLSLLPTGVILVAVNRMPDDFPTDEEQIEKEGIDIDLVEMTNEEMNKRQSYDETNVLIQQRRSSIIETMEELGLYTPDPVMVERPVFTPTPSQRKIADLALQGGVSRRRSSDVMFESPSSTLDAVKEDTDIVPEQAEGTSMA